MTKGVKILDREDGRDITFKVDGKLYHGEVTGCGEAFAVVSDDGKFKTEVPTDYRSGPVEGGEDLSRYVYQGEFDLAITAIRAAAKATKPKAAKKASRAVRHTAATV